MADRPVHQVRVQVVYAYLNIQTIIQLRQILQVHQQLRCLVDLEYISGPVQVP
jgi:hypothetical protein